MSKFGKNIRKIRNAKKISQTVFANLFNLKRSSIGAYEEGRAEAKIDTIIEIANYYDLSLDKLLKEDLSLNDIYHINTSKYFGNSFDNIAVEHQAVHSNEYVELNSMDINTRMENIEKRMENIENLLLNLNSAWKHRYEHSNNNK